MAGTLIVPTISPSPANGGTCDKSATTRGTWDNGYGIRGEYQQYRFSARPAVGFVFVEFRIHIENYNTTGNYSEDQIYRGTYNADTGEWEYESPPVRDVFFEQARSPSWWETYPPWEYTHEYGEVTVMTVVAVFEQVAPVHTGLLIRNAAGTGLLRGVKVARPLVDI